MTVCVGIVCVFPEAPRRVASDSLFWSGIALGSPQLAVWLTFWGCLRLCVVAASMVGHSGLCAQLLGVHSVGVPAVCLLFGGPDCEYRWSWLSGPLSGVSGLPHFAVCSAAFYSQSSGPSPRVSCACTLAVRGDTRGYATFVKPVFKA